MTIGRSKEHFLTQVLQKLLSEIETKSTKVEHRLLKIWLNWRTINDMSLNGLNDDYSSESTLFYANIFTYN